MRAHTQLVIGMHITHDYMLPETYLQGSISIQYKTTESEFPEVHVVGRVIVDKPRPTGITPGKPSSDPSSPVISSPA
jgi:hypothetical protein